MYGAEAVILNLCLALNASGQHEGLIGVFANSTHPNLALHEAARRVDVTSYVVPCTGQLDFGVPAAIRELVRRTRADVVHTHGYKADIYAWSALRRASVPLVATCHTWYDNDFAVRVYGAIDRWVLKTFDSVVAVSEEVRGRLLKARVSPERIHCIRNGVNLSPFANVAQIRRARQQSGAKFHIGLVGRLAPEKGVDIFLHAAAEIRKKHPDVGFLIAGDGPDRELLDSLKDNLALGDSVTFCGLSDDMPAFYASIDLLVSASRREGMPIALLEAIAAGLPVVATSVGAVPEVIRNGHNGLLVPPCSVSDLTNAVSQLLEDVNLRKALAESAQRSASEEFSAERMSADHCDLYRRVITLS